MDLIDEFCKQKLLNSSLFMNNTAKFIDPNFDLKAFLCDVLKFSDIPDINPILEDNPNKIYDYKLDFNALSSIGDPRVSFGLTLSAGFLNFMPRNIVYSESLKFGGSQVINNIVCDADGNPVKVSVPTGILNESPSEERDLAIFAILSSEEVRDTYGNFDFSNQICLDDQELIIAEVDKSIDQIDLEPNPNVDLYSNEFYDLFEYGYGLDVCLTPLDTTKLFERTTPDEYTNFTKDFVNYGYRQHSRYLVAFLKKYFINRGWTVSFISSKIPPLFFIKLTYRSSNADYNVVQQAGPNNTTIFNYISNIKMVYIKYYEDQIEFLSKELKVPQIITSAPNQPINVTSQGFTRAIGDTIPDYRRIVQKSTLQKKFYKYVMKYYLEVPKYNSTTTLVQNPTPIIFTT
jgi:hypothetical protein